MYMPNWSFSVMQYRNDVLRAKVWNKSPQYVALANGRALFYDDRRCLYAAKHINRVWADMHASRFDIEAKIINLTRELLDFIQLQQSYLSIVQ